MDFFGAQIRAKRNSFWLALWFTLAVLGTVVVTYFGVSAIIAVAVGSWDTNGSLIHGSLVDRMIAISLYFGCLCALNLMVYSYCSRSLNRLNWIWFFSVLLISVPLTLFIVGSGGGDTDLTDTSLLLKNAFRQFTWLDSSRFFWTFLAVGSGVALGSIYKTTQIVWKGAKSIAIQLGGQRVFRNTDNLLERRLFNTVDEISIAAGVIAPLIFVLKNEHGVNAFAIGLGASDNLIAVTQGALDQLSRDELQALIAHEMSHLVNGDARLNLRLIGWLHGILMLSLPERLCLQMYKNGLIAREELDEDDDPGVGAVLVLPVCILACLPFYIIGSIGAFFGRLIKSAISREREFLADAAAVQYSRNPDALAGALRKIQQFGSRIDHPNAEVVSHMFFGAWEKPSFFSRWFASHPPIQERLARLKRVPLATRPPVKPPAATAQPASPPVAAPASTAALAAIPVIANLIADAFPDVSESAPLGAAQALIAALPPTLLAALPTSVGAKAAVYALLIHPQAEIQQRQLDILRARHSDELATASLNHAQWLAEHGVHFRLPLLDLALPALRELPADERQTFMGSVDALIQADGRLSPSEFAFRQILQTVLLPSPVRSSLRLERLDTDIACLLAFLAYAGARTEAAASAAYEHASLLSPMSHPSAFPAAKTLRPEAISDALNHLSQASRPFREKFLKSCAAAVEHDGKITPAESELLRAFAQSLNCPAPLVVDR